MSININTDTAPVQEQKRKNTMIIAGTIGCLIEWFDYTLYAFFAAVIATNFFPAHDPMVSLIMTFIVFGVGYFARPLGSFIFGYLGDKIGRKDTMSITVIIMGVSTFVMGILPVYAQIGIMAPVLLALCRMLQGIAVGGEWGSAVTFMGEYSSQKRRAFIVSFTQIGGVGGMLIASVIALILNSVLTHDDVYSWGWRIAFLSGILIAIFGYYMRRKMDETPAFQKKVEENTISKNPLSDTFRGYKKEMIVAFCCLCGTMGAYYVIMTYMPTYIGSLLKLPAKLGLQISTLILLTYVVAVPLMAILADKFGRKPLLLWGSGCITLFGYPLFYLLGKAGDSFLKMGIIAVIITIFLSFVQGCASVAMSELFPVKVRVSGFSIPYQLSVAIFGGTAMAVVTWLFKITGNVMVVPIYMCLNMLLVFICVLFLYPETKDRPYDT